MNLATHSEARVLVFALRSRSVEVVSLVDGNFALEILNPLAECPAEFLLDGCCSCSCDLLVVVCVAQVFLQGSPDVRLLFQDAGSEVLVGFDDNVAIMLAEGDHKLVFYGADVLGVFLVELCLRSADVGLKRVDCVFNFFSCIVEDCAR